MNYMKSLDNGLFVVGPDHEIGEFSLYNYGIDCIPDAKRGYYGFIIVVVRVRRDFVLATYSPHFFPDFFHIWQVA